MHDWQLHNCRNVGQIGISDRRRARRIDFRIRGSNTMIDAPRGRVWSLDVLTYQLADGSYHLAASVGGELVEARAATHYEAFAELRAKCNTRARR